MSRADLRGAGLRLAFAGERATLARLTDSEPSLSRLVCVYCTPHHVIRAGSEPVSHGACPIGVATFEAGRR